jgi:hypothetical protein
MPFNAFFVNLLGGMLVLFYAAIALSYPIFAYLPAFPNVKANLLSPFAHPVNSNSEVSEHLKLIAAICFRHKFTSIFYFLDFVYNVPIFMASLSRLSNPHVRLRAISKTTMGHQTQPTTLSPCSERHERQGKKVLPLLERERQGRNEWRAI